MALAINNMYGRALSNKVPAKDKSDTVLTVHFIVGGI